MNDDRQLLELAAKAAGHEIEWLGDMAYPHFVGHSGNSQRCYFNPLNDDGDALRLAVKLLITVTFGANYVIVGGSQMPLVNNANDPYAATRRAIVRAAAEIGKEMA